MKKIGIILLGLLTISISIYGQESKKDKALSKSLKDFEGAVYELEVNYAGFATKTSSPSKSKQYSKLKTKLHKEILNGRKGYDAVGELYGWFGDNHLRTGLAEHSKYRKTRTKHISSSEGMDEYDPEAVAQKVDSETFLIRFPSCDGEPSLEWINQSIKAYQESQCKHLIIDIRGNGGGQDTYYKPYLKLLYDKECISKGVEIRNSEDNINYLRTQVERLPWLQEVIEKAENSNEAFIPLVEDFVIKYDTIHTYPIKAAIIIDSNVASSGEQMLLDIRGCSTRTKIYGKGNTLGCLDYSNIRRSDLKGTKITTWIPMTRSSRLPDEGIDETGIAPDVRMSLPLPKVLSDNVDEWVLWIAEDMKKE